MTNSDDPHAQQGHSDPPWAARALCILWPSFLMAGVMEMLVFAVVDPAGLQWFGGAPISWSRTAVYSVSFLLFWGVISTASALTQLLIDMPDHLSGRLLRRPGF